MKLLFVSAFAVFALSALDRADSSAYDKILSHSRIRAKDQGPNVCALQQVSGTKKKYFSTCRNWYRGSICGKKAMVLYECCPGYMRLDGMPGCAAVAPIDHVYGTLGPVNAIQTQKYADMSKLRPEIEGEGSYTMFAPSNEAWELLDPEVRNALESNVNIELYNALHYHMVNKRLLTKDMKDGLKVISMYNDLGLHINHYPNGIVTVNCARIIHGNQVSTNGVVHVIDRVISAVGNTIRDVIEVDDDLSSLKTIADNSGLMDKLGEKGQYTLFAPTNKAFDELDSDVLERMMGDKGVLKALLNFHLLNSAQCSEAIMAGTSFETLEGHNIEVGCDGDSLTVNGVKMVLKKDIVTTNGVIHLIEKVLIPDSAKQVTELIGESQGTFGDMVAELGLAAAMRPKEEYTLLAPVNTAFTDDVMGMDQRLLKIILENHVLKKKFLLNQLYNGQRLESIGGKSLRVFIYRTSVCIENACMVRGSKEGTNGALHLMKGLIKPAVKTMFQILTDDGRFKMFLSLIEAAGLTDLLNQEGDFTLFAPTDDAFEGMSQRDIALLTSDINALRTILLYHLTKSVFIGAGLEGGVTNLMKSLQGSNLKVISDKNGLQVNTVGVDDADVMASNGVIHIVKRLLYPAELPVGSQDLLSLLRRLITQIQFRYVAGHKYKEIPLTFLKRVITRVVEADPAITKVTRVIEGDPTITKVTRVIEGDPTITKVTRVIQGEPTITKVTRVVEGDPTVTKVTRVIEGDPTVTKVTRVIEGDPTLTHFTRVVSGDVGGEADLKKLLEEGTSYSHFTTIEGDASNIDLDTEKITKLIEGKPTRRVPPKKDKPNTRRRGRQ
ncbi:periostin, osteoblast specific factor b isoform X2 [Anguilla rostrata]|uniref:periostin, osteoblast specific factor b isoform X2 n=1 Tax=Anguilla rostrata TaxID=7938 RepID=UPI0030CD26D3